MWLVAAGAALGTGAAAGVGWLLARDGLAAASAGPPMARLVAALGAAATLLLLGGIWGVAERPGPTRLPDRALRAFSGALVGGTLCAVAAVALAIPLGLARAFP